MGNKRLARRCRNAPRANTNGARARESGSIGSQCLPAIKNINKGWFWAEVSSWLPLRHGLRISLRAVGPIAANGVLDYLEADGHEVWMEDLFGGLLPDLLSATPAEGDAPALAQGSTTQHLMCCNHSLGNCPEKGNSGRGETRPLLIRSLGGSGLSRWLALAQRFPSVNAAKFPARLVFGSRSRRRDGLGEDVTTGMMNFPSGTLLYLEGRVLISNCFNSITQLGSHLDGAWWLRHHKDRVVLERFGKPFEQLFLGEYKRFHGMCSLPYVMARWDYIVNVSLGANNDKGHVAELLRPAEMGDPIEKVFLPPRLACAAYKAVVVNEGEEALLLQWSVGSLDPVPVRVAVYDSASRLCNGAVRVVDESSLASHLCFAVAPPTSA